MTNTISNATLNQQYTKIKHSSGLDIMLCPMHGFSTTYAMFAAKVGSIDVTFKTQKEDDFVSVPAGIAHFLEHKMFESQEGDTFAQYAKTGASANAFTGFDKTAYLFSCTDNFEQSLRILIKQVTEPYFTKENVDKEQGIIAQEIQMYDDNPGWRVMFNLLQSLYHNNPIKTDIAGDIQSISEIDADLLYRCYNTFYNLNNMALVICGNFDQQSAVTIIDEMLKPAEPIVVDRKPVTEPYNVVKSKVEQSFPVSMPLFQLGFKIPPANGTGMLKKSIIGEVLLDVLCGEASDLYRKMYDSMLINASFGSEILGGRDYICAMIDGESQKPDEVRDAINSQIANLQKNGVDEQDFMRCKKAAYGRYVSAYCKPESLAHFILTSHFAGLDDAYKSLEIISQITITDLNDFLQKDIEIQNSSLSVINPV